MLTEIFVSVEYDESKTTRLVSAWVISLLNRTVAFQCWKNSPSMFDAIHNAVATSMTHF